MKILTTLLTLVFSLNLWADCRPDYERNIASRVLKLQKVKKIGLYSTGGTFVTVGSFFGYMGVALTGPLWSGVIIGSTFGAGAALPVGATFLILNQSQKVQLKHRIQSLNIIADVIDPSEDIHELEALHQKLVQTHPEVSLEEMSDVIRSLNDSRALCDGSLTGGSRKLALPKDILRYLKTTNHLN